ncbi:unnamed protein product [Paramecium sonneborni]|uniref:Transmembrane protein n=1 Tax=Paramecium sonneborni TaxID=65129 RepID=A0A8S1NN05_9CILI|nr:unnamed protein product [Paramecium sonneborni]
MVIILLMKNVIYVNLIVLLAIYNQIYVLNVLEKILIFVNLLQVYIQILKLKNVIPYVAMEFKFITTNGDGCDFNAISNIQMTILTKQQVISFKGILPMIQLLNLYLNYNFWVILQISQQKIQTINFTNIHLLRLINQFVDYNLKIAFIIGQLDLI